MITHEQKIKPSRIREPKPKQKQKQQQIKTTTQAKQQKRAQANADSREIPDGHAPLGIIAKSTSPLRVENRRERFKLQALSSKIHAKDAAKKVTEARPHFSQIHRVCGCCWSAIAGDVFSYEIQRRYSTL